MNALYDTIGLDYAALRRPDPRIAAQIAESLGPAKSVLNVGAGAGSYEPEGRAVTAVEPSSEMIAQRTRPAAAVVQARAEELPFADKSFDAAMAVLTLHHWSDQEAGVHEMRRVTKGPLVFLTYDPAFREFWLLDYIPALAALDDAQMPPLDAFERWLGPVKIDPVPIPYDCTDGFLAAYWRRPRAYLDPRVRAAISSFWALGDLSGPLDRLDRDLQSEAWHRRYGHLLTLSERDCGYRLVVCPPAS